MNANANTVNTDANDEAAKKLADMFAGATIEDYSINGGTITLTLAGGDTIAIRHETKEIDLTSAEFGYIREECEYVDEGVTSRAAEAIKNGQAITAAWVEKREAYESHTPYDEYDETPDTTTETIELWVMFEGDLRPTRQQRNRIHVAIRVPRLPSHARRDHRSRRQCARRTRLYTPLAISAQRTRAGVRRANIKEHPGLFVGRGVHYACERRKQRHQTLHPRRRQPPYVTTPLSRSLYGP